MMRTAIAMVSLMACAGEPVRVATGQLEEWTAGPVLPTPRANHCSAAIGDWVLAIGGNFKQPSGEFAKTDEIHAARVTDDGVMGPWQLAGRTASPVTECSATTDGARLYVIDGIYDVETDGRQVFAAPFDQATGMLGELGSTSTLPSAVISSEAAVRDGRLLVMDTLLEAEGDRTVTYTFDADAWLTADWGIGFRAQAEYAFSDRFAYTLGGYTGGEGNPATSEVFVATLDIRDVRPTTPLPEPVIFGEAVAVDDWVFVVGGRSQVFGGVASTRVFAAQAIDGALGAWREVAELPMGRTNHELVLVGDDLVVVGGADAAGGDANVLMARVRFP
jgi:hypothetical protein